MRTPEGLNGDPAFSAEDILVGRCPGNPYGYNNRLRVTVSIRMEWLTRQDVYETVNHEQVTRPLDFSITTGVWNPRQTDIVSGGATVSPLMMIDKHEAPWTEETVLELARLGKWHLNGMRAGCAHQERNAGLDSPPCPITGYKWGHGWLVRPLPDGFLDEVKALFDLIDENVWSAP